MVKLKAGYEKCDININMFACRILPGFAILTKMLWLG